MEHWCIEVFKSYKTKVDYVWEHHNPKRTDTTNNGFMQLRGLTFGCTKEEIVHFSSGLNNKWDNIGSEHHRQDNRDAFMLFAL